MMQPDNLNQRRIKRGARGAAAPGPQFWGPQLVGVKKYLLVI